MKFVFIFLFNTAYSSATLETSTEKYNYYYDTSNLIIKSETLMKLISQLNFYIIPNGLWKIIENLNDNIIFIKNKNRVVHNKLCTMFMFGDLTSFNYE